MSVGLKKCPFCGSKAVKLTTARELEECANFEDCEDYESSDSCPYIAVVCDFTEGGCGATSGYKVNEDEAVKAWNNRAE